MTAFYRPPRSISQPALPPVLRSDHPLAQGIVFSAFNSAAEALGDVPPMNVADGSVATVSVGRTAPRRHPSFGLARQFTAASSEYHAFALPMALATTASFSAWVYWPSFGAGGQVLFTYGPNDPAANVQFHCTPNHSGGAFAAQVNDGVGGSLSRFVVRPAAGWVHVGIAYKVATASSGDFPDVYFNGVAATPSGTTAHSGTPALPNNTLWVARRFNSSTYTNMAILGMHIWKNRRLTGDEFRQLAFDPYQIFWPEFSFDIRGTTDAGGAAGNEHNFFLID